VIFFVEGEDHGVRDACSTKVLAYFAEYKVKARELTTILLPSDLLLSFAEQEQFVSVIIKVSITSIDEYLARISRLHLARIGVRWLTDLCPAAWKGDGLHVNVREAKRRRGHRAAGRLRRSQWEAAWRGGWCGVVEHVASHIDGCGFNRMFWCEDGEIEVEDLASG
jgi:hypothetical protein